ncbi:hypothetical protein O7632_20240 [Solwaraspora sp. WMMD406]|nr:hypothetical protein [Solwaraspora sp. WMMD406]MDG4766410.1 hypothetical protein [Solwaraspora sp. WMMD406]
MKLMRAGVVAALVTLALVVAGFAPAQGTGVVETNPPGWPSCCGVAR